MQALTIHEPWASLLVKGKKQFETREWQRNYRGLLAIHAGKQSVHPFDYPLGLSEILDDSKITQDNLNNNNKRPSNNQNKRPSSSKQNLNNRKSYYKQYLLKYIN